MISQIVLDSDEFQQVFCEGCPAVSVIRGGRDSLGVPQDPDDVTCPAGFVPGDGGCVRCDVFELVVERLEDLEAWLKGAVQDGN